MINLEDYIDYWSRSEHMRKLHREGRYKGTSKIGDWNKSDEKRERMKSIREKNSKDKSSTGYGSEHHMRLVNRQLLFNKLQGKFGYLYFLDFPASIKIGFSKDYEGRVNYLGGKIITVISGPTEELADIEFDTLIEFIEYTQLDSTGTRYTEFMDKKVKSKVRKFIDERVKKSNNLKYVV